MLRFSFAVLAALVLTVPSAAQVITKLADLDPSVGTGQKNPLTFVGGAYYFTCRFGGNNNHGTVAAYVPGAGVFKVADLLGPATGKHPTGGMALDGSNLYFTCTEGGTSNAGTLSKLDLTTGVVSIVLNLSGYGSMPAGRPLVFNGHIFLTTEATPVSFPSGAVIRYNLANGMINSYATNVVGGSYPRGGFLPVGNDLYFTCRNGGTFGSGIVAKFDTVSGIVVSVAHLGTIGVSSPEGDLVLDGGVAVFTANSGGTTGNGALVAVDTATGTLSKLTDYNSATGTPDGATPVVLSDFILTTSPFGGSNLGSLNLINNIVQPIANCTPTLGYSPARAPLVESGSLLNLNWNGGALNNGTVVSISVPPLAAVAPVGSGCGLINSTTLALSQAPRIGQTATASFGGGSPFVGGAFVVSGIPSFDVPLGNGCTIYVDPSSMIVLTNFLTSPFGAAAMVFPFPALPALSGLALRLQAATFPSPGGVPAVELSNGLNLLIGY